MKIWQGIFFLAIILLFNSIVSATNHDNARAKLKQMNIPYNDYSFVKKAVEGDIEAVKLFITAGMAPNVTDQHGNTTLIMATIGGEEEIIDRLLGHGAKKDGVRPWDINSLPLDMEPMFLNLMSHVKAHFK